MGGGMNLVLSVTLPGNNGSQRESHPLLFQDNTKYHDTKSDVNDVESNFTRLGIKTLELSPMFTDA